MMLLSFGHLLPKMAGMSGRKVSVPISCIVDIWPDETPLDSCMKYQRIIHGIIRKKIGDNDFSVSHDGVIQVNL